MESEESKQVFERYADEMNRLLRESILKKAKEDEEQRLINESLLKKAKEDEEQRLLNERRLKKAKEDEKQRLLNESILKKAKEDEEHRLRELMIKQAKEDEERKLKKLEDQRLKEKELVNNDMKKKISELEYSLNQKESYISKKKQSKDASLKENERTKSIIKHKIEKMKSQEKEIHDMDYCLSSSHSLIDNEISQRKQINLQTDAELDLLNEEEMNIKEDMERFAKVEDDEDNKRKIQNILERNLNEKED